MASVEVNTRNPDVEKDAEERELSILLLGHLTGRQRDIIERRFMNEETLEEIGGIHNICKQRVREIIDKSIRIMKNRYYKYYIDR